MQKLWEVQRPQKPKFEVKSLAMIAMMLTFGYLDICVQMMIWKVKFVNFCAKTVVGTKTTETEVWSEVTGNDSNDVDILDICVQMMIW